MSLPVKAWSGVTFCASIRAALRALAKGLRAEVTARAIPAVSIFAGRIAGVQQQGIHRADGNPEVARPRSGQRDEGGLGRDIALLPWNSKETGAHLRSVRTPVQQGFSTCVYC